MSPKCKDENKKLLRDKFLLGLFWQSRNAKMQFLKQHRKIIQDGHY